MSIAQVERALRDVGAGRMVVLVDDESRENEGDLCMAADAVRPEDINFMVTHGRGLVCLTLTPERLAALALPPMVPQNNSSFATAFTVSIEARTGVSTGISAADRARTIAVAVDERSTADDLARPGHVFPLRAREHGVLCRDGQTEGSVDLARLAGRRPAGVICEILADDGSMMRMAQLRVFAERHRLCVVSVADVIAYRLARESCLQHRRTTSLVHPRLGELRLHAFVSAFDGREHVAIERGASAGPSRVRVQPLTLPLTLFEPDHTASAALDSLLQPQSRLWQAGPAVLLCVAGDGREAPLAPSEQMARRDGASASDRSRPVDAAPDPTRVAGAMAYARLRHGVAGALLRALGRLDVEPSEPMAPWMIEQWTDAGVSVSGGGLWASAAPVTPAGAQAGEVGAVHGASRRQKREQT